MNEIYKNIFTSATILFLFIAFSIFFNTGKTYYETFNNTLSFIGGSYLMSSLTQKPLNYFLNSISLALPSSLVTNVASKQYLVLMERYSKIENTLTSQEKKSFREKIELFYNGLSGNSTDANSNNIYEVLDQMLLLLENKNKIYEKSEIDTLILSIKKVSENKLLDKELSETFNTTIFVPIINNLVSKNKLAVSPIFLKGEPGVGKTTFVNNFSKELNIPVYHLKLNDLGSIYGYFEKHHKSSFSLFSRILVEKYNKKSPYIIVCIDEVDKDLGNIDSRGYDVKNIISRLLTLLNTNQNTFYDDCHEIEYDISNIIFIFCGNKLLGEINESMKPFDDRFTAIEFPNIPTDKKYEICLENFKRSREPTESDEVFIKELVGKDTNPGLRKVLVEINNYICRLNVQEYVDSIKE